MADGECAACLHKHVTLAVVPIWPLSREQSIAVLSVLMRCEQAMLPNIFCKRELLF